SNPNIKIYTSSTVKRVDGFIGNFEVTLNRKIYTQIYLAHAQEEKLKAGTMALKNAMIIKEMLPDSEVSILYRDMQAYGKDFEEQYEKARQNFVQFIR